MPEWYYHNGQRVLGRPTSRAAMQRETIEEFEKWCDESHKRFLAKQARDRRKIERCKVVGCSILKFEGSDYCYKHKNDYSHCNFPGCYRESFCYASRYCFQHAPRSFRIAAVHVADSSIDRYRWRLSNEAMRVLDLIALQHENRKVDNL